MTLAPANPAQIAMARARSSGGNTAARIDRVPGMTNAAARPMTARAAITTAAFGAKAATSDAPPNTTSPPCSAPLRPNRSPTAPAGSSIPANTSE